jgi:K+-transporting ATPase KdpF subunit
MSALSLIGLLLAVLVTGYLLYVMIRPERF